MTGFWIGAVSGLKQLISYHFARWAFGRFFVPFGIQKKDCRGCRWNLCKDSLEKIQDILFILVNAVSRENCNSIRIEEFYWYLNKVQKINSADKVSLYQWWQGLFLCACNLGPVDRNDIDRPLVAIGIESPFTIDPSPSRSGEGN